MARKKTFGRMRARLNKPIARKVLVEQLKEATSALKQSTSYAEQLTSRMTGAREMAEYEKKSLREQNKTLSDQVTSLTKQLDGAGLKQRETDAELKRVRSEAKRSARALHILTESTYEG